MDPSSLVQNEPSDLLPPREPPDLNGKPTELSDAGRMLQHPLLNSATRVVLLVVLAVGILYFAKTVLLPIVLAGIFSMTLSPLITWLAKHHLPAPLSAAVVLGIIVFALVVGFAQMGGPAVTWMNQTPEHMTQLRERIQKLLQPAAKISRVAAIMDSVFSPGDEAARKTTTVQVKSSSGATMIINWTGGLLVRLGETFVLVYLLLISSGLFLQKLVRVLPTLRDKRRAIEISREIQERVSNYLFTVTLINIGLGIIVGTGLYFLGVPNPAMWGALAAILNYIPYFGPILGILVIGAVGLITFDSVPRQLLPAAVYLGVHLLEANFITPILLGRRFIVNPVVIFVSLMFWMWLWGVTGALLSVPMLMAFKSICDHVPTLSPLSEFLER